MFLKKFLRWKYFLRVSDCWTILFPFWHLGSVPTFCAHRKFQFRDVKTQYFEFENINCMKILLFKYSFSSNAAVNFDPQNSVSCQLMREEWELGVRFWRKSERKFLENSEETKKEATCKFHWNIFSRRLEKELGKGRISQNDLELQLDQWSREGESQKSTIETRKSWKAEKV